MSNWLPSPQEAASELLARRKASESLIDFTTYTKPEFQVGQHHQQIAEALESVERGECDRLMIFAPPRHTKSELGSRRFPAWYLGRHPDHQMICATYSGDFALDFGRDVRGIVGSEEYANVFPDVSLAADSRAGNRWHTNKGGISVYVGVGGPITGRGAHVALIDDPFKNRQEADSEARREMVWKWYTSTLRTRLMPGGAIVLILTRWHEDDLAGRLLAKNAGEWKVVNLPAVANEGTKHERALWPAWYPLDSLKRIKADVGPRDWSALYQQEPAPAEGTFFKREWFRRFRKGDEPKHVHKYMTSDHAPAGGDESDFNCVRVWGVDHVGDLYMLDGFRAQETLDQVADKVVGDKKEKKIGLIQRHKPMCWFPEDDNNWKAIAGFVTRMMREQSVYCRVEPISPHGSDKPTKAQPFQAMASMGRVWIPEGPEGDDVIEQYLKFPVGKNDDEVDAAAVMGRALDMAHPAILPIVEQKKPRDIYAMDDEEEESWRTI